MRFDSSKAWSEASQTVSANRDMLLALAGVFLVLPAFALGVFWPQPEPPAGASPEQLLEMLGAFYGNAWPAFLGAGLFSIVGTLAMLALFTDARRPTVGEAIMLGLSGTLPVIAAQILMGMGIAAMIMLPVALAGAMGMPVLAVVAVLAGLGVTIWLTVRLSLLSPAVMVDGIRNPITALQRSWQLTQGKAGSLLVFYVLVVIAFLVVMLVASMLIGLVLGLALPANGAVIGNALIAAVLQAVFNVYMVGIVAACHRQLAGPSANAAAQTFE